VIVKRCFFPSRGRIERRINSRKAKGQVFVGTVWSFWWGPLCAFLVYDEPEAVAPQEPLQPFAH
jgi:hypothetical protein